MSLSSVSPSVILTLNIHAIEDVISARQRARQIAKLLGFDLQWQTRIATVVSEIARNAYQYAGGGKITYCINMNSFLNSFLIKIADKGPGIPNLKEILSDENSLKSHKGLGILGSKKIVDNFTITSSKETGTTVIAEIYFPPSLPMMSIQQLAKITDELLRERPKAASDEVQQQNHELLLALNLLNKARDELEARVNERTLQLENANEELRQKAIERTRMEAWMLKHQQDLALVERVNSMGEMASVLAHELNSPLASITSYTQGSIRRLKTDHFKKDELLHSMEKVAQQAMRAGEIIHRMKGFIKKGILSKEETDIHNLIRQTILFMQHELDKHRVAMHYEFNAVSPFLRVDIIQIQQVFINLIRNAIQAMHTHTLYPCIVIRTQLIEDIIEVNVLDNGPGFSVKNPEAVLEPYFTTKKEGMGMGLSISRTIIEAHSGKLFAKNNPEGGAWFQFFLPTLGKENNAP